MPALNARLQYMWEVDNTPGFELVFIKDFTLPTIEMETYNVVDERCNYHLFTGRKFWHNVKIACHGNGNFIDKIDKLCCNYDVSNRKDSSITAYLPNGDISSKWFLKDTFISGISNPKLIHPYASWYGYDITLEYDSACVDVK